MSAPVIRAVAQTDAAPAAQDWKDRRGETRRPVTMEARLRNASGLVVIARLQDISENGCALAFDMPQAIQCDEAFSIKFGNLEAQACWSVWVKDDSVGLRFDAQLSGYIVDHLAQYCH